MLPTFTITGQIFNVLYSLHLFRLSLFKKSQFIIIPFLQSTKHMIDTHCHLDADCFNKDFDQLIITLKKQGLKKIVIPGYMQSRWNRIFQISETYPDFLYPAPGIHPLYIHNHSDKDLTLLDNLCLTGKAVAVGETGIDLQADQNDLSLQKSFFTSQLHIASSHKLPVLIHSRKGHDQVYSILRKTRFQHGGIVHAFNGSLQQAERFISLGFKLGFGGTMTYKRAKNIRLLAASLPLDSIVLETDAPDMPLFGKQEEPNSPQYLPQIAQCFCSLRKESKETILQQLADNCMQVLPKLSTKPNH